MRMFGFGFPGQGFHCLKIPGTINQQAESNVGFIHIENGDATAEKLEEEMKNLIDSKWALKVMRISNQDGSCFIGYLLSFQEHGSCFAQHSSYHIPFHH